jgi:pimeloyl-ACP methyl ester carboxylesterase
MPPVNERTAEIDGLPVLWHEAPGEGIPVLYVHGVPEHSAAWKPFLERIGGIAPDLPGFGRSGKPGHFDYSIPGYDAWLERFLDHVEVDRFSLVVHDWGSVALALAQRAPERVHRLVIMNAVPLLPGYRWHRIARVWRTRGLGELFMGLTTKWGFRQLSRESNVAPGPMPDEFVQRIWDGFDQGTQRAILRLYRSAPEDVLAAAGADLGRIGAPTLVLWGDRDPYIAPSFGDAYAAELPNATVEHLPDAGHWPWYDRPELIERVATFLEEA